jgi:uroporphyrinogen-III synthase
MGRTLIDMKVLVTRPRSQADSFTARLKAARFEPILFPAIGIRPVGDLTALDGAIAKFDCYDWVVFTSARG